MGILVDWGSVAGCARTTWLRDRIQVLENSFRPSADRRVQGGFKAPSRIMSSIDNDAAVIQERKQRLLDLTSSPTSWGVDSSTYNDLRLRGGGPMKGMEVFWRSSVKEPWTSGVVREVTARGHRVKVQTKDRTIHTFTFRRDNCYRLQGQDAGSHLIFLVKPTD